VGEVEAVVAVDEEVLNGFDCFTGLSVVFRRGARGCGYGLGRRLGRGYGYGRG
jgi:hypothetical protein